MNVYICYIFLQNITKVTGTNIFLASSVVWHIVAAVLVFVKKVYVRIYFWLGVVIWAFSNLFLFMHVPFLARKDLMPMDNVPAVFTVIFVTHTMLPVSRKVSLSLGVVTGIVDIVVIGVLADIDVKTKMTQLASNLLIYTCSNITGLYHKHLTDIAHRHTFLDTRKFLESDIKYRRQRESQVSYILNDGSI